jgi:hypothetical protein
MTTLKQIFVLTIIALSLSTVNAQDLQYVRKQLNQICSPEFHGRAYYKRGDSIAADYLTGQFKDFGLRSFGSGYLQDYSFNVNSVEELSVKINGETLDFGIDYMINPSSGSLEGSFEPVLIDASMMRSPSGMQKRLSEAGDHPFIILDSLGLNNPELYRFVKAMAISGQMGISGLMEICPKLPIGRVGRSAYQGPYLQIARDAMTDQINKVEIVVKNRYYENYPTQNVIGFIQGVFKKRC